MHDLVIVGAGPHGREIVDIIEAMNAREPSFNFLGFVDDGPLVSNRGEAPHGPHVGPVDSLQSTPVGYVLGIGEPGVRSTLDARLSGWGCAPVSAVHPLASIGGDNRLGAGLVMAAGARITTNVSIGRHVHLNVNAVVSHDCDIGGYTTIAPGAHLNGDVTVGARTYIGSGAVVLPQIHIGERVMIGAGAVVTRDIPDGAIAKGVPARF